MPGTVLDTGAKEVNGTDEPVLTALGSSSGTSKVKPIISEHEGPKQDASTSRVRGPP